MESCNIFDTIVNNKSFTHVAVILFLNKTDLLAEKVHVSDIGHYFPTFSGNSRQLGDVQQFELQLFDSRRLVRSRPLFHHFTTLIDGPNMNFILKAVVDTILGENLKSRMLL